MAPKRSIVTGWRIGPPQGAPGPLPIHHAPRHPGPWPLAQGPGQGGGTTMDAGFLGVGNMGQPMAEKLLDGGHRLTISDINEAAMRPLLDRQASRAASPKELADRHAVVVVSLPPLGAFRSVVFGDNGLLQGDAMKILINTCTVGVKFIREIESAMAARGVTIVDSPI